MLLKTAGYFLFGAISWFALSTAVPAEEASKTSTWVLTPLGYRDSANVHYVPDGYDLVLMPDGHMRAENTVTGDHIDFVEKPASESTKPISDNGWVTYASWLNQTGKAVSSFTTTWAVPAAPSTYDGQTLFQFNSIEPNSFNSILQPVLQYGPSQAGGGRYWAVASWYVVGNSAYYSSLVRVSPGQTLVGVITLASHKGSNYNYKCAFTGISGTNFSIKNIPQLTWCTETLEVYGVDLCPEFPNTPYSQMYRIKLKTGKTVPSVSWSVTNAATSCGVQTTIVTNNGSAGVVDIYF
jgi:hypothetical protein